MSSTIMDEENSIALLQRASEGRLATCGNDRPYITPVNFVYDDYSIFIHTGFKGRKLDNIKSNPYVCFEISEPGKIIPAEKACKYSFNYVSVLVFGKAVTVDSAEEKLTAINLLLAKYAPDGTSFEELTPKDISGVNVVQIKISEITGKKYSSG
jgi:hypothetical protein